MVSITLQNIQRGIRKRSGEYNSRYGVEALDLNAPLEGGARGSLTRLKKAKTDRSLYHLIKEREKLPTSLPPTPPRKYSTR